MQGHKHHEQLIKGVYAQFKSIMEHSKQAVYIYLDDEHLIWNKKFGDLVGYKTVAEVKRQKKDFLELFVDKKSWKPLVNAYRNAMEHAVGSKIPVTIKHKSGKTKKTQVILVPINFEGHLMAMHFIE